MDINWSIVWSYGLAIAAGWILHDLICMAAGWVSSQRKPKGG